LNALEAGDNADNEKKARQYDLAYTILHLGYQSTDTIDRGKKIYECALLEYHKLMRQDPFWVGACESVVLLLSILGYDDLCLSLISFMLRPPPSSISTEEGGVVLALDREGLIRQYTSAVSELAFDLWIYGPPSGAQIRFSDYDQIRDTIPKQWGTNVFLVPLMLIKMRQCAGSNLSTSLPSRELKMEAVEVCRQVEYSADFVLPVLRSLFPDSRQRWGKTEVCALLANVDSHNCCSKGDNWTEKDDYDKSQDENCWEESCFTFWMLLKDCYAFTPGILDVLEETIDEMTKLGINVIPEDPPGAPTADEYTDFVKYMAEQQRNGTL
jgi:hypothetical protein